MPSTLLLMSFILTRYKINYLVITLHYFYQQFIHFPSMMIDKNNLNGQTNLV